MASNKTSVATVAEDGTVTAVAPGTATITATVPSLGYSTTFDITVVAVEYETPEINIQEGWIFTEGKSLTLEPKAKFNNGAYAPDSEVTATYESSDEAVAKVVDGELKAVAPGAAKITAHITYKGKTLDVVRNINVAPDIPPVPFEVNFELIENDTALFKVESL